MFLKRAVSLILFLFFAACQASSTSTPVVNMPHQEPSSAVMYTPVLSSPTSTPVPQAPTDAPMEHLAFTVATDTNGMYPDTIIAFANRDGTDFEAPGIFEPFRWTGGVSGKYLVWSPDGRYLAFDGADKISDCGQTSGDCFTTNYGMHIVDFSQGAITRQIEGTLTNPAWSPDSRNLVLSIDEKQSSGSTSGRGDLFIFDVKSGRKTQLTSDSSNDLYPAWSPDGQWIAFIRYAPASGSCGPLPTTDPAGDCDNASLYAIRPDGRDLRLLAEPIHVEAPVDGRHTPYNAPSWSPDSQRLVLMVESEGLPSIINQEIAILDFETRNLHRLTNNNALDVMPAWSPAGQRIAFVSDRDGNEEVYTMSIDGTDPINLTKNPGLDYAPAWSPSGNYIAFVSNRGIYTVTAAGINPTKVNGNYFIGTTRPSWFPVVSP